MLETFTFADLLAEEKSMTLPRFSRQDALSVGLDILKRAKQQPMPIAVEITINGLVVFRHFMDGVPKNSENWLMKKKNTVDLMSMSSLRFGAMLKERGLTLADRALDPALYAVHGGGYPIVLEGTGQIGSLCVSGLADRDDHQLILDALAALKVSMVQN